MPRVVLVWQGEEAPRDLSLLRGSVEQTSWDACQPQTDQTAPHKRCLQWHKSDKVDSYPEYKR